MWCSRPVKFARAFACAIAVLSVQCGTPFFPQTGDPPSEVQLRLTPEGVVQQLVNSYESRRFDLFEELLYSEQDFRFYVELDPNIYTGLTHIQTDRTENVKLNSNYVQNGAYVYLTYSDEVNIHRKLFQNAQDITFDDRLQVVTVEYLRSLNSDSSALDSTNAAYAVVRTDNASIRITADIIDAAYGDPTHVFPVGKQVFYVKKDSDGLWRILYWFELDASS
jgi:hypothetical protein